MVFGLFKRKDPICGMKEEKGKGFEKNGKWFCSQSCLEEFEKHLKKEKSHNSHGGGCCH